MGGSNAINVQEFIRGVPEAYDAWASLGNDQWSFVHVLADFRKSETDLDVRDDFHGTDGPIPVRRHIRESWNRDQEAFFLAPDVQPQINYHYLEDPWDLQPMPDGARLAVSLVEYESYSDIVAERLSRPDSDLAADDATSSISSARSRTLVATVASSRRSC